MKRKGDIARPDPLLSFFMYKGQMPQPPDPANLLFTNLFVRRERTETLHILSLGLHAISENCENLLNDAKLLLDSGRYSRAHFLIATADEEMAKIYILLDACKLDFTRHEGPLRRLCRAFYSHVEKYAYNQIYRSDIRDLQQAKELFHIELQRWWPSGFESGEPDLPHDTHFARESNLYADFIDFDQAWWIPSDRYSQNYFEMLLGNNPFETSRRAFAKIKFSLEEQLLQEGALDILNAIFKNNYIREDMTNDRLFRFYDQVAEAIEKTLNIPQNRFNESILRYWPLYHFLQNSP
jgi:AbiV family abortive infection protein